MDFGILAQAIGTIWNASFMVAADAVTETSLPTDGYLGLARFGAVVAGGVAVIGAALGIGNIAGKAVESIARQPEAGGRIFTSMVVAAALIEGFTFFALVVAMLAILMR